MRAGSRQVIDVVTIVIENAFRPVMADKPFPFNQPINAFFHDRVCAGCVSLSCEPGGRSLRLANLGGVSGNGGDVCNVVPFFEGWDRVDVQDDTGNGSAGLEYELAEIVGDKADFHALLNVGPTLHKRVPNARAVGQDIHDPVEPDRILDGPRTPGKHFESAHGVECPVDEQSDVIPFDGTGIASFDNDGRFAASSRGVVEVSSGAQVGGTVAPNNRCGRVQRRGPSLWVCGLGSPCQ